MSQDHREPGHRLVGQQAAAGPVRGDGLLDGAPPLVHQQPSPGGPHPAPDACAMRSAARSRARRVARSMDRAAAPVTGATVLASAARSG